MGRKGDLIIIGGAEDKHGRSRIPEEVVRAIGSEDARICIITTATQYQKRLAENTGMFSGDWGREKQCFKY